MLNQPVFFEIAERGHKLMQMGVPLVALNVFGRPPVAHLRVEFRFSISFNTFRGGVWA